MRGSWEYHPRHESEKKRMIERAAIAYGHFLTELGFDWEKDENSRETPTRVAKAWVEDLISGSVSKEPKITSFPTGYKGITFDGNIEVVSMCAHHHLPFTGTAYVAYLPGERVIGLSKINRIVEFYSRRPQIQEDLTQQIHDHLESVLEGNYGIMVVIKANHTCCSNRGVKHKSQMVTSSCSKFFLENKDGCKDEMLKMIQMC
jgi:GTP cyclohydrolase I